MLTLLAQDNAALSRFLRPKKDGNKISIFKVPVGGDNNLVLNFRSILSFRDILALSSDETAILINP